MMERPEDAFAGKNPGASIFARITPEGHLLLAVSPRRLVLQAAGTISTEHLIAILKEASNAGLLVRDDFSALIDLRDFTGMIDWKLIPQVREIMPKGENRSNKNAYVVRNAFFDVLVQINAILIPDTQHATFRTEQEARRWLEWE